MLNYYKSIILLRIHFRERLLIKKYFVFNYLTGDYGCRFEYKIMKGINCPHTTFFRGDQLSVFQFIYIGT